MKLEELNSMKYGEILKLAKEKLNITRRVSKDLLIEKLLQHHQNLLSDSHFISTDESTDTSSMESEVLQEPVQKRGRKRGNEQCKEKKKAMPVSKKAKKESVEHTLNSTFSVDEESDDAKKKDLPLIQTQATIPRKLRGRKKAYLTEESSANESENEKVPAIKMKKSASVEGKEQTVTQNTVTEKSIVVEKVEMLEEVDSVVQSPTNELVPEQIPKRKLKKSMSAGEQHISNETMTAKMPARRTRSSDKAELLEGKSDKQPTAKKETKSNNKLTAIVPSLSVQQDASSTVIVEKKTLMPKTSNHSVRSRRSTANFNTPAKVAVTPAASAKKAVHFTASSDNSNNPKIPKRKAAPNFAEIHQKNFMKMESVDEYVDKKRTRTETLNASAKTVRTKSVFNNSTPQIKPHAKINTTVTTESIPIPTTKQDMKFNFVSGLQKPVFTAKGQVVNEKQRVMATVKENLHNNVSQIPAETITTVSIGGKRKASMLNVSRDINTSKLSMAGKQILKGVRTNRRFELQMQHRNMKN